MWCKNTPGDLFQYVYTSRALFLMSSLMLQPPWLSFLGASGLIPTIRNIAVEIVLDARFYTSYPRWNGSAAADPAKFSADEETKSDLNITNLDIFRVEIANELKRGLTRFAKGDIMLKGVFARMARDNDGQSGFLRSNVLGVKHVELNKALSVSAGGVVTFGADRDLIEDEIDISSRTTLIVTVVVLGAVISGILAVIASLGILVYVRRSIRKRYKVLRLKHGMHALGCVDPFSSCSCHSSSPSTPSSWYSRTGSGS